MLKRFLKDWELVDKHSIGIIVGGVILILFGGILWVWFQG